MARGTSVKPMKISEGLRRHLKARRSTRNERKEEESPSLQNQLNQLRRQYTEALDCILDLNRTNARLRRQLHKEKHECPSVHVHSEEHGSEEDETVDDVEAEVPEAPEVVEEPQVERECELITVESAPLTLEEIGKAVGTHERKIKNILISAFNRYVLATISEGGDVCVLETNDIEELGEYRNSRYLTSVLESGSLFNRCGYEVVSYPLRPPGNHKVILAW